MKIWILLLYNFSMDVTQILIAIFANLTIWKYSHFVILQTLTSKCPTIKTEMVEKEQQPKTENKNINSIK